MSSIVRVTLSFSPLDAGLGAARPLTPDALDV